LPVKRGTEECGSTPSAYSRRNLSQEFLLSRQTTADIEVRPKMPHAYVWRLPVKRELIRPGFAPKIMYPLGARPGAASYSPPITGCNPAIEPSCAKG